MHTAKPVFTQAPSTPNLMIHVARKISTNWYQLGILLHIETSTLKTFETQTNDPIRLCIMVFAHWEKEEKVPYTWETIITALTELEENKTVSKLKKWLDEQ